LCEEDRHISIRRGGMSRYSSSRHTASSTQNC
jgi:hypothetical protein